MKTWHKGRLWLDWGIPYKDWYWSFHSLPCCWFFLEAGPIYVVIGTGTFEDPRED